MLKLNSELRAASRTTLSGNWTIAALVTLLYLLIAGGVSSIPKVGTVVSLIITYPLVYGFAILFLDLFREGKPLEIGKLFLETDPQIRVDTLTSANAALSLLESETFDAIISDYQMPGMNGDEALAQIRSEVWGKKIPVIILTNTGKEEAPQGLGALGIEGYIVKAEMTPKQVVSRVKESLDKN
jgi:CheY-like chemotaxis protein